MIEYVCYHSGIMGEGCRVFEHQKWERFEQTSRRERGATRLKLVHRHGQCCDGDCVVSLPPSGKSLIILFPV